MMPHPDEELAMVEAEVRTTAVTHVQGRFPILRMLFARRRARVLAGIMVFIIVAAVIGGIIAQFDPAAQDIVGRFQGPGTRHWLGSDYLGRDIFARLMAGTQLTIFAAFQAVAVALVLGVPIGLLAGYKEGWVNLTTNTISDTLQSLPPLILALAFVAYAGPGVTNAMIAVGVVLSPRFFRVARGAAASISKKTYIEASRAIGCSTPRLLVRHVLTNSLAPLMVQITFSLAFAIVAEASLSFLGVGARPPAASLGNMVQEAFNQIGSATWPIYPPSVVIVIIVFLVSALGDSLQDALVEKGR